MATIEKSRANHPLATGSMFFAQFKDQAGLPSYVVGVSYTSRNEKPTQFSLNMSTEEAGELRTFINKQPLAEGRSLERVLLWRYVKMSDGKPGPWRVALDATDLEIFSNDVESREVWL